MNTVSSMAQRRFIDITCLRIKFRTLTLKFLFTHSLCCIYFTQFIHHILFNVSAIQSLYQESFSFNITLPYTADADHFEYFCSIMNIFVQ